jgi:hypothetical protein
VDYPYRPPRVDEILYQAALPDAIAFAPIFDEPAAETSFVVVEDSKKKGKKGSSKSGTRQLGIRLQKRVKPQSASDSYSSVYAAPAAAASSAAAAAAKRSHRRANALITRIKDALAKIAVPSAFDSEPQAGQWDPVTAFAKAPKEQGMDYLLNFCPPEARLMRFVACSGFLPQFLPDAGYSIE